MFKQYDQIFNLTKYKANDRLLDIYFEDEEKDPDSVDLI